MASDGYTLVIGAGKSGQATARFLLNKGEQVYLYDSQKTPCLPQEIVSWQENGLQLFLGGEMPPLQNVRQAVISPGVPLSIPLVQKINEQGIPLCGELEFAFRHAHNPFVAITGTNGKTTTTALLGQMAADAGRKVLVGGNIGRPLIDEVEDLPADALIVAEVSSFQLETIRDFAPKVSLLLNITPDHLNRHGSMENYIAAKGNIFINQTERDFAVFNYDDPTLRALAKKCPAQVVFFSRREDLSAGVCVQNGVIVMRKNGRQINVLPTSDIYIKGGHNLENAMAAVAAGDCLGFTAESMAKSLVAFTGMPHRLETVGKIKDVLYINDSKGTNPDSTIKAIEAYPNPLLLLAGGYNKNSDFTEMLQALLPKCQFLLLLGATAETIAQTARKVGIPQHKIIRVKDLPEAMDQACNLAKPGDIVLLSPACASWDMFENYEQRGDIFKQLVREKMGDRNGEKA